MWSGGAFNSAILSKITNNQYYQSKLYIKLKFGSKENALLEDEVVKLYAKSKEYTNEKAITELKAFIKLVRVAGANRPMDIKTYIGYLNLIKKELSDDTSKV